MSNGPEFVLFVLQHLEPPSVEEQTWQSSQNESSAQGSNRKPIFVQMFKSNVQTHTEMFVDGS